MRIDNSYLSGFGPGEIRSNAETAETGSKGETKAGEISQSTLHIPSPELAQYRQLVQISPDVRPDVVSRVSQLLESGYYNSPAAAEQTADAMIIAIDP
jgi:hypothetical protein